MSPEKFVDESWKESALKEKAKNEGHSEDSGLYVSDTVKEEIKREREQKKEKCHDDCGCGHSHEGSDQEFELNFSNYVTSLAFQALIFMGEMPNPMTHEEVKNLEQSKFLIDTLLMLKDKTKGNLTKQEEDLLNATCYELQMKYVEIMQKESKQ